MASTSRGRRRGRWNNTRLIFPETMSSSPSGEPDDSSNAFPLENVARRSSRSRFGNASGGEKNRSGASSFDLVLLRWHDSVPVWDSSHDRDSSAPLLPAERRW